MAAYRSEGFQAMAAGSARALNSGPNSPKALDSGSFTAPPSYGYGPYAPAGSVGTLGAPAGSFQSLGPGTSSFTGLGTGVGAGGYQGGSFQAPPGTGPGAGSHGGLGAFDTSMNVGGSFANAGGLPQQSPSFTMPGSFTNVNAFNSTTSAGPPHQGASFSVAGPDTSQFSARARDNAAILEGGSRPLTAGSYFGGSPGAHHHGTPGSKLECQDQQCAEEECNPDECGDENRPPRDDNYTCGIDRRPLLPVLLVTSTLTGGLHMMMLQFPLMRDTFGGAYCLRIFFLLLYSVTLGTMAYFVVSNPGLLQRDDHRKAYARLQQSGDGAEANLEDHQDPPLPKRAHKAWLYQLPVRRYDHFCRWLTNCIGLLNHREFVAMVGGLVAIGACGCLVDVALLGMSLWGKRWVTAFFLLLHLVYSVILCSLAGPILRLHIGFVSRNELANEWKRNDFYVITSTRTGKTIPVNELSDDEFNERFDAFEYDSRRNPFDRGTLNNCWSFWCTPRWTPGQLGEF